MTCDNATERIDKTNEYTDLEKELLLKVERLDEENRKMRVKNKELMDENTSLKINENNKKEKVKILIDNVQVILTEFYKDEINETIDEAAENQLSNDNIQKYPQNYLGDPAIPKNENLFSMGAKQKSYSCQKCEKSFTYKNDLFKHSKVHNVENFQEKCDQCDFTVYHIPGEYDIP